MHGSRGSVIQWPILPECPPMISCLVVKLLPYGDKGIHIALIPQKKKPTITRLVGSLHNSSNTTCCTNCPFSTHYILPLLRNVGNVAIVKGT